MRSHSGAATYLREGIKGVDQLQLCISTESYHLVHLLQLQADDTEARHEFVQPPLPQLLISFPDLEIIQAMFNKRIISFPCIAC